jgi:hypothetical protein
LGRPHPWRCPEFRKKEGGSELENLMSCFVRERRIMETLSQGSTKITKLQVTSDEGKPEGAPGDGLLLQNCETVTEHDRAEPYE